MIAREECMFTKVINAGWEDSKQGVAFKNPPYPEGTWELLGWQLGWIDYATGRSRGVPYPAYTKHLPAVKERFDETVRAEFYAKEAMI